MKRSNKINFKHRPRNRSSSIEGFAGVRCSDNRSDATTSRETEEDMSRVKRVRFQESKADHHPNAKAGATSIPSEAATGARSNAPKTSEFAFFKKIREKACNHSYQLSKEGDQVKDVRSRESKGETPFMFEQSRSYLMSSLHVEKARPLNQQQFPSPFVDTSKGSGLNHVEPTCKNITPPLPLNKVKPGRHDCYSSSLGSRSRNSGNQYSDKDIFSAKRQKLWQLVADTTLVEVDEPCSKRSSLVSVLLSRLFPENTESKLCRSAKSREIQNDIQQQQTVFPDSGMHVKRHSKTRTMNLNATADWPYFNDARVKSRSSPDISTVTPELDIISSDSPSTSYAARTSTEYPYSRSLRSEHHKSITSFLRENDSYFLGSFSGCDFTPSGHQYLLDYNEPESRVQRQNHLLSWDDNSENYEQNIAAFPENTESKLCWSAKSREIQNDIQQQQTVFPDSGMHVNRHSKTRTMNLNATADWPYFNDARVKSRSSPDISTVTPELDIISSDSPSTSYAARTSTEYPYSRSLRSEHHKSITSFLRENDSYFLDSFGGYDFTPSGHQYLLDYNEPESRAQRQNHLLSWDDNSENYEQNIAALSFNTDVNSFPMLEAPCSVDDVQGLHNELICLPPLFSENSQNFHILPHYHLDTFHGDSQSYLGEENYQGGLTLPRSAKYLNLIEDCIPENALESSTIELPPPESFQFPTRLEFTSEWKFLSMADSSEECRITNDAFWFLFKEGLWSHPLRKDDEEDCTYHSNSLDFYEGRGTGHDWSVSNFKQSRETDCSFLLHDSSWDLNERETYIADVDVDDHYDEWKGSDSVFAYKGVPPACVIVPALSIIIAPSKRLAEPFRSC